MIAFLQNHRRLFLALSASLVLVLIAGFSLSRGEARAVDAAQAAGQPAAAQTQKGTAELASPQGASHGKVHGNEGKGRASGKGSSTGNGKSPAEGKDSNPGKGKSSLREGAKPLPPAAKNGSAAQRAPGRDLDASAKKSRGEAATGKNGQRQRALKASPRVAPSDVLQPAREGGAGGCLREYGKNGQCVPQSPPSSAKHQQEMARAGQDPASMKHPWTCAELRTLFPDGVAVRVSGVDPQGLDRDNDGIACGAKDGVA